MNICILDDARDYCSKGGQGRDEYPMRERGYEVTSDCRGESAVRTTTSSALLVPMRLKEPDVGAGAIEASDLVSDGANCLAMRATRWADVKDMVVDSRRNASTNY